MPAKYRVGVIGHTGRGDYGHGLDRVWLQMPECQIIAVADPDDAGRAAAARRLGGPKAYADWEKMLDEAKPDIVSICPRWLDQHRDIVVGTAQRGVHIYLEKPLCRTLAEADQMAAACEKNNVKLAIAFQTRYSPKLAVLRNMIEDGKIGQLLELRGRGKEDRRGGGEDLWVLGSHIMNLMHFFGGEPNWCFATVQENRKPVTKENVKPGAEGIGPLAGDALNAMYGMDDGVTAYFGSHRNTRGEKSTRFGLRILGSKGAVDITTGYLPDVYYLPDPIWSPPRSGQAWVPVSSAGPGEDEPLKFRDGSAAFDAGNTSACRDLIAAIEEDRHPEASIYEARTTVEMITAVFESHRVGGPVAVPLETRENPLGLLE